MKKILASVVASLLALSLIGCGAKTPPPQDPAEPPADTILYAEVDPTQWSYLPAEDDPVTQALITIDTTPYGTAGSSLAQVIAGVNLIQLTQREETLSAAKRYLDGMTPLQLDYFSFQWQTALATARSILTEFPEQQPLLSDAGFPDFDPAPYKEKDLETLDESVRVLLTERGVTDVWKTLGEDFPLLGA